MTISIWAGLNNEFFNTAKKIDFSHLSAMPQLGAPGLQKAGALFIDVWYHMKPREPLPCVGKALGKKNFCRKNCKNQQYCLLSNEFIELVPS